MTDVANALEIIKDNFLYDENVSKQKKTSVFICKPHAPFTNNGQKWPKNFVDKSLRTALYYETIT